MCGVKNTMDLAVEATSDSTMVQVLMIDVIQKNQSEFILGVNCFSHSVGREIIVDNPNGNNITHAKQQRLNRSK